MGKSSVEQAMPSSERGALKGIRVAITRAMDQAEEQRALLEEAGAEVVHYPCIAIAPPREREPLDNALRRMVKAGVGKNVEDGYDWLVLTSVNSVSALTERIDALSLDVSRIGEIKVAAIGASTRDAAETAGLTVTFIPPTYTAESLVATIPVVAGDRVLLPQSAIARSTVADGLREAGALLTVVTAYRTLIAQGGDDLLGMLWAGSIDAITFTSESTVRYFNKRVLHERGTLAMLDHVVVGCIGPATAQAAHALGLRVQVQPGEHTLTGLTGALVDYFKAG